MNKGLSLNEIRAGRETAALVARTYKLHPKVLKAFEKQAIFEGHTKTNMLEKMIVEYLERSKG